MTGPSASTQVFSMPELVSIICGQADQHTRTALARVHRVLYDPALTEIWRELPDAAPLFATLAPIEKSANNILVRLLMGTASYALLNLLYSASCDPYYPATGIDFFHSPLEYKYSRIRYTQVSLWGQHISLSFGTSPFQALRATFYLRFANWIFSSA